MNNLIDFGEIKYQTETLFNEAIDHCKPQKEQILILGCSRVAGFDIGTAPNLEMAEIIIDTALTLTRQNRIFLAVQGCEHINRAIAIEFEAYQKYNFEEVNVLSTLKAGGACCELAYKKMTNPVMIEKVITDIGIDIGDTSVGMHVKFVQVPFKTKIKSVGKAHVSCLTSRPKLIGGNRASYK